MIKEKQNKTKKQNKKTPKNENAGTCWDKKKKATQEKMTIQLVEINQKVLAKEGRLKRYREMVKQYRQNRTSQNNERKFYQQVGGNGKETNQQPDATKAEKFWSKI